MRDARAYLDYNATAPVRPEAVDAMNEAIRTGGNASSIHQEGRAARALVEQARGRVAAALNAPREGVIFTSGGTEANNLALRAIARRGMFTTVLVGATEHPSVLQAAKVCGLDMRVIGVDAQGIVDLDELEHELALNAGQALVSLMLVNNETGAVEPVREAAALAHRHQCIIHTDAVQAVGKIETDFGGLGVDLMSVSAHKVGGPQGAGALVAREGLAFEPEMVGGGQELRRRAGTENLPGIVGFGAALQAACGEIDTFAAVSKLRDRIEAQVLESDASVTVFSSGVPRLPNTSCFARPGLSAELALIALDLNGVAVSSGSACSSGKVARSHVLGAMGVEDRLVECAIRVSLGWASSAADAERFGTAWKDIVKGRAMAGAAA
jgi:cysteine desulfurase